MICRACLRAASRSRPLTQLPRSTPPPHTRFLSSTSTLHNIPCPPLASPAAQSALSAQPLSDPLTPAPSPELKIQAADAAKKKASPLVKSSIPAGTPLKGLNFEKNKQDPVALADEEYPAWLWGLLERKEGKSEGEGQGDLFSKSKKQRRVAAKRLRKEQAANPGMLIPKVPVYEQTIDLPAGDGSLESAAKAAESRNELTKAMRGKRRAGIKEKNFLKAMG